MAHGECSEVPAVILSISMLPILTAAKELAVQRHLTTFSCNANPRCAEGWDLEPLSMHSEAAEPTTPHLSVCCMGLMSLQ